MKIVFGLFLILAGIFLGIYVGLVWAFIGGIISLIEQIRAPHLEASVVAWDVVRILCASALGGLCGWALIVPGVALLTSRR